jgi:hypothetical protein
MTYFISKSTVAMLRDIVKAAIILLQTKKNIHLFHHTDFLL